MKIKIFLFLASIAMFFASCDKTDCGCVAPPVTNQNKVLVLKVDFTTNVFEGGKELIFPATPTFTIQKLYQAPLDFGYIKLNYQELNLPIFDGSIHWNGMGSISFPADFQTVTSFNLINPITPPTIPIFVNLDNSNSTNFDYTPIWNSIKYLEKVNEYRSTNPNETVKIILYTPDVGIGNPANWKWIVLVKN